MGVGSSNEISEAMKFALESCRQNMDINYMLEENIPLHRFRVETTIYKRFITERQMNNNIM